MKNSEMIALALAGVAVYMLVTARPKTAVTSADGRIPSPTARTHAEIEASLALGGWMG